MKNLPEDLQERIRNLCDTYDLDSGQEVADAIYWKAEESFLYKQESFYIASHRVMDVMDRYFRITKGDDF